MRIGIDARLYKAGLGIGRYIEQLLIHLEQLDCNDEYVIFLRKDMMEVYQPNNKRFKKVCLDVPWYSVAEQIIVPIVLYTYHLDIVHFPHFNVPILYAKPFIMTIHDILMMKHAESSKSAASSKHAALHWIKYQCYRFVVKVACARAQKIIAVSQSVKADLVGLLSIPEIKIEVIHEGVQMFASVVPDPLPDSICKPYYLNVGNAYPHKNISLLLDVFEQLKKERSPLMLVLCGQEDYFRDRLVHEIEKRNLNDTIIHLGYVSDGLLRNLYLHAQGVLFPSFEEGFGFGPLEAAAAGAPIIASDIPCFREMLGTCALTIDPRDPHAMLSAIHRIDSSPDLVVTMRLEGKKRVELFSWQRAAEYTHDLYHSYASQ